MRRIREVLRLRAELGPNLSAISAGAKLARSTVRAYLDRATAAGLDAAAADGLSETALEAALYPPSPATDGRTLPDWAEVDQELRRHKHVTRKLLWMEYKTVQPDGLGFSQFKLRLSEWQKASGRGLSMRQVHHAGETVQVDYAGDTVAVMDDGRARAAQIFVACLPCSGLIYAEASWTQTTEDWLGAHVRLFSFLGGVPAKVVPDNLKVGVTHASYYDPVINASYAALIKHYGTAVVPARSRKPRDKPGVENGVLQACRWLLAPLRHRQFFSLTELNQAIALLLVELNDKPMAAPREGSRRSLFEAVESAALKRLPIEPYVVGHWATEHAKEGIGVTVNVDYHVPVERNFYSVPYALVRKRVDVFVTRTGMQIFHRGERSASHARVGGENHWATLGEHMPPAHSAVAKRTPDWVRGQAAKVGVATAAYVERLLTGRDHVEQGVRSCLGILRLATRYPSEHLEAACVRAMSAGANSSGFVEHLLKSGRPLVDPVAEDGIGHHGNIRGPGYYH
jgi:transposase